MCGDGANDCGALKAANTGISLSDAESSVASPFTSKNANISCTLEVIKEGRAALVTSFGIFKFMAAYSLNQFVSVLILYSMDSNLTDVEFLFIDLFLVSLVTFFFGRTGAYEGKLVKETPPSSLMSFSCLFSLVLQMLLVVTFQTVSFFYLKTQPWYVPFDAKHSDDKDNVACFENYTIFSISNFQYIILAVVFSKGKPYRNNMFSNYGFLFATLSLVAFAVYLAVWPMDFLVEQFELILAPVLEFRLILVLFGAINFIVAIFFELVIIDFCVFKKLRSTFHNIEKSKREYLVIERDLNNDFKWPVLTSDFTSAASPLNPLTVSCTAEIVVEKENRFDKNHVLNRLYDEGQHYSPNKQNLQSCIPNGQVMQEDLPFSSLPSESSPSLSETYKSFPSGNTTYDLANSQNNIAELPYDSVAVSISSCSDSNLGWIKNNVENDSHQNLSSFNSFGVSPKFVKLDSVKALELNFLENNR